MNDAAARRISEQRELIKAKKKEMETAGHFHKMDLRRSISRMEKELRVYIGYQRSVSGVPS